MAVAGLREATDQDVVLGLKVEELRVDAASLERAAHCGQGDWGIYYGELENYYVNCVIGGPRAFAIPAKGFQEFAEAVRRKLVLEISDA